MKIEYIKDAPIAKAGDTAEVADNDARVLMILGYAKEHKPKRRSKTKDADKDSSDDTDNKNTDE